MYGTPIYSTVLRLFEMLGMLSKWGCYWNLGCLRFPSEVDEMLAQ